MGAIMRESDEIFFHLEFGDLHYLYSQPRPYLLCLEICYPNASGWLSFFSFSLWLP